MSDPKAMPLESIWAVMLKDLGLDAENVLRRAELARDLLRRDRPRISIEEYFRFWRALEHEAGDPCLPITLTELAPPEAFQPPVFAALCSSNLSVAVRRLAQYKRLIAPMILDIEERSDVLFVGFRWEDPHIRPPASLSALELLFVTRLARIGTRERIEAVRVESPHRLEPEPAFRDFFGVAVESSDRHGVSFRSSDARRPFLTANEELWQTFEPELQRRLSKLDVCAPMSERVRSVLLETLPSGETNIDTAARRLGTSARTLQRKLREEGSSYKDVVRGTREDLARHYLTRTRLSYAEIGFLLGFAEPSSFFRAFRGWTGRTPEAVRLSVAT